MIKRNWAPACAGATRSLAAAATMALVGCTVGPDYKRPDVDLPASFGTAQLQTPAAPNWWQAFNDPALDQLIAEALASNQDLRAAAERIEQSRALLGLARSDQFPEATVDASVGRTRASELGSFPLPPDAIETKSHRLVLRASWEIDFWGRYRRATEAARADLVASEAGADAVRASLIADVARGYFALRSLDQRLVTLERDRVGREKSLELQKLRLDAGVVSELEYAQVESDLRTSESLVPTVRQLRVRQESALALLVGRTPRGIMEVAIAPGSPAMPDVAVPAGLPSELLLRRPDLREAEARLHAATARIGVARAAYFPSISLTGYYGGESQSLSDLFSPAARTWSIAGGLIQPIVAAGRIQSGVDLADARAREAEALYRRAIANSFREVRDAIAAQANARDAVEAQARREGALVRSLELARLRYDNGAINLFELLETERRLLLARLDAIEAERDRRNAVVELYIALGA